MPAHLPRPAPAVCEAFEPRILYAADVAALAWTADDAAPLVRTVATVQPVSGALASSGTEQRAAVRELVVVDLSLPDAGVLLAGLQAQRDAGRPIEIVTLQPNDAGMADIGEALSRHAGLDALHLLTHGSPGQLRLGADVLDGDTIALHAAELARWSQAFSDDADWLIYGCDVAAGVAGAQLLDQIALLGGADVAASLDPTGAVAAGGDWVLERSTGPIQAASAADANLQQTWSGLMASVPSGSQFTVNGSGATVHSLMAAEHGTQNAVARDAQGRFVVVWATAGLDGSGWGVYGRRFDADGTPLGLQFQVNATTAGDQNYARVAMADDGRFVVVWTSSNDGNGLGVYARTFAADGTPMTADILVNTTSIGTQQNGVVAMSRTTGEFAVAWEGSGVGDSSGVFLRRFAADGTARDATERRVNTATSGTQSNPAITMARDGSMVVAWEIGSDIEYQRYGSNGNAQGGNQGLVGLVDGLLNNSSTPALSTDDAGNVTLVWREDSIVPGLYGVRLRADGSALTSVFQAVSSSVDDPAVSSAGDGQFMVTWAASGASNDGVDIMARQFRADATPVAAAFRVNSFTGGTQQHASAAHWDANHAVVVWSGTGLGNADAISARLYAAPPAAPVITSGGGGSTASVSADENQTDVMRLTASDENRPTQTLVWSIAGGADAARFTVDASTGDLRFAVAPNAEAPADANEDNTYEVVVRVSDGALSDTQALSVKVLSVADDPVAAADYAVVAPSVSVTLNPLANDTVAAGRSLRLLDYSLPALGSVRESGSGLIYTAPAASANDRIRYLADDGQQNIRHYWRLDADAQDLVGGQHGTLTGSPAPVRGAWGEALQFDGSGRVQLPDIDYGNGFSLAFWFRLDATHQSGYQVLLEHGDNPTVNTGLIRVEVGGRNGVSAADRDQLITTLRDVDDNGSPSVVRVDASGLADGQWHYYMLSVQPGAGATVLVDSTPRGTVSTAASLVDPDGPLVLGGPSTGGGSGFTGALDGVMVIGHPVWQTATNQALGNDIARADIAITVAPGAVTPPAAAADRYTLQEDGALSGATMASPWWDVDWAYRQSVSLANSGAAITDAPIRLVLDTPALVSAGMDPTGADLRFVDRDQTALSHAVESWSNEGPSVVWVRVPQVDAGDDDGVFLYFGNATATSSASPLGVWGSAAAVVLHMGAPTVDSSAQAHTLTTTETARVRGVQGDALRFNGSDSDLAFDPATTLDNVFAGGGAVSAWIRPTGWGGASFGRIASKADAVIANNGWAFQLTPSGGLLLEYGYGGSDREWLLQQNVIALDEWTHVAVVYNADTPGTPPVFYVNGVAYAATLSSSGSGAVSSDAGQNLHVGNHSAAPTRTFEGSIDEFRLWNATRSAAEIQAEYAAAARVTATVDTLVQRPSVLGNDTAGSTSRVELISGPSQSASFSLLTDGRFNYTPRADFAGTDSFTYQVVDNGLSSAPVTVTLEVEGVDDAPRITSFGGGATGSTSATEGSPAVATMTAVDPDDLPGFATPLTWSLVTGVPGTDSALFRIEPTTGALSFIGTPDHESPADADGNNVYRVIVKVSDGQLEDVQTVDVTVQDRTEPPLARDDGASTPWNTPVSIAVLANDTSVENGTLSLLEARGGTVQGNLLRYEPGTAFSGTATLAYRVADSAQGLQHHWRLDGDAQDAVSTAHGRLVGGPAIVEGAWGQALRLDEADDAVELTDLSYAASFTLQIRFRVSELTGTAEQTLFSHGTPGAVNSLTVSLGESSDPTLAPTLVTRLRDAAGVASTVSVDAAGLADGQWHTVTLVKVQGAGLSVYLDGELAQAGTVVLGTFNPDGPAMLGRTVGAADDAQRYLGGDLDSVSLFNRALNDAEVRDQATDGSSQGQVTVTVGTQPALAPVITSDGGGATASVTVDEGTLRVTTATATDANLPAQTLTWRIAGGADQARFAIDAATGVLSFAAAADAENPWLQQAPGIGYEVIIEVSDGALTDAQTLRVTVRDVDEFNVSPVDDADATANRVSESATVGTLVGLRASAADLDAGTSTVTYALDDSAGGRFRVDPVNGDVRVALGLYGGAQTSFDVVVRATSDDGSSSTARFSIAVDREAPVGGNDAYTLAEDSTLSGTASASGWWNPAWTLRQRIDVGNGGAAATDVAVRLTLDSAAMVSAGARSGGADLRFVQSDGTVLAHRIESWSDTGSAAVWVRLPSVAANLVGGNSSSSFYAYFGNASAPDTQSATLTFGADAVAVITMGPTPADLSANRLTLQATNTASAAGILGDGQRIDSTSDRVVVSGSTQLNNLFAGGGTVTAWINPTNWGGGNNGRIVAKADADNPLIGWDFHVSANGTLTFEYGRGANTTDWITTLPVLTAGQWNHVAVTYNPDDANPVPVLYVNGTARTVQLMAGVAGGGSGNDSPHPLWIGNHAANTTRNFNGVIDDLRLYTAVRSADQIAAEARTAPLAAQAITLSATTPIERPGLLANDRLDRGNGLTVELEEAPAKAQSFTLSNDGSFTYRPTGNFFGTDRFTYRVFDGIQRSAPVTVTLNVTPVNDAPVIVGAATRISLSVAEDQTVVGTLRATDADDVPAGTQPLTWSLPVTTFGVDRDRFSIDARTGQLSLVAPLDFETPSSLRSGDGIYDVSVEVSDGTTAVRQDVTVTVTNVVEPVQAAADAAATRYNTAVTINVLQNDVSRERRSLQILDAQRGQIASGQLVYTPDTTVSGRTESFLYRAIDRSEGLQHHLRLDGDGTDVFGAATGTLSGGLGVTTGAWGRALRFDGVDDQILLNDISYGSTGYTVALWFRLDGSAGNGERTLYEHGTRGATNSLSVSIGEASAADERMRGMLRTWLLDSTDATGKAPVDIPLTNGPSRLDDGAWHLYTLVGGTGGDALVYIDGQLRATIANGGAALNPSGQATLGRSAGASADPNRMFEGGLDGFTVWSRALSATEVNGWFAGDSSTATVSVAVGARPSVPPVITSGGGGVQSLVVVPEGRNSVTTVTATDPDVPAETLSYALTGGTDRARFSIDAATGELRWQSPPDYENPWPAVTGRTYEVIVQVSDGTSTDEQLLRVSVTDVNESPVGTPADVDATADGVDQRSAAGSPVGVQLQARDPDGTDNTVRYALLDDAGGRFQVDASTGVIRTASSLAADTVDRYVLVAVARSSDGSQSPALTIELPVSRTPNEAPRMPAQLAVSLPENRRDVMFVTATDPDAAPAPLRYRIAGGADAARFRIDDVTGELSLDSPADAERPADADADNRYEVRVEAFDGQLAAAQDIVVTITNVDEAPRWVTTALTVTNGQVDLQVQAADDDTPASALRLTVAETTGGWFALASAPGERLSSFTQAQLQASEVVFRLDGSGRSPGFGLLLSDGTTALDVRRAVVTVIGALPVSGGSGTVTSPVVTPAPAPAPAPAAPPASSSSGSTNGSEPSGSGSASSGDASGRTGGTVGGRPGTGVPTGDGGGENADGEGSRDGVAGLDALLQEHTASDAGSRSASSRAVQNLMSAGATAADSFAAAAGLSVRGADLSEAEAAAVWRGPMPAAVDTGAGSRDSGVDSSDARTVAALMQAMNRVREEVTGEELEVTVTVGSTALLSGSLSVGYVLWLLRGGVLMATVVSSVPAWAGIDPLPVLRQGRSDDDESDDEGERDPIERLFSRARRLLHKNGPDAPAPAEPAPEPVRSRAPAPTPETTA
jgi:hypothetical protein